MFSLQNTVQELCLLSVQLEDWFPGPWRFFPESRALSPRFHADSLSKVLLSLQHSGAITFLNSFRNGLFKRPYTNGVLALLKATKQLSTLAASDGILPVAAFTNKSATDTGSQHSTNVNTKANKVRVTFTSSILTLKSPCSRPRTLDIRCLCLRTCRVTAA